MYIENTAGAYGGWAGILAPLTKMKGPLGN